MDALGIGAVADLAKTAINRLWPDKSEQEKQEIAAAVLAVQGQIDTNKAEAGNPSVFVSGWRPFIGWVCGSACAWNWIGLPIVKALLAFTSYKFAVEQADISQMLPVLFGMLGLGGLRTIEKINGVAAK